MSTLSSEGVGRPWCEVYSSAVGTTLALVSILMEVGRLLLLQHLLKNLGVRPARYCPPRHRMPVNSSHEGSIFVG